MIEENNTLEASSVSAEEINDDDLESVTGGAPESCYYAGKRYSHGAERGGQVCNDGSWI